MNDTQNTAPIFIVGSPRSGTSILTWCLGQHSNILPLEESDWIGPFAVDLGVHYTTGSARGERSQLSALGVSRDEFFGRLGNTISDLLRDHRRDLEAISRASALHDPDPVSEQFCVSREADDPKRRWVDGTPENALYICALHKLFPAAKFVHIVRDARDVAASLLNFRNEHGAILVADEEQAYAYWEQRVRACVEAEQALGAKYVYRLRYVDLIERPETTLCDVLEFLGETFEPACIEPLDRRINSSFADEKAQRLPEGEHSDLIAQALQLSDALQHDVIPALAGAQASEIFEDGFAKQVEHQTTLREHYRLAREFIERKCAGTVPGVLGIEGPRQRDSDLMIVTLRHMVNICGAVLMCNLLLAAALNLRVIVAMPDTAPGLAQWWLVASVAAIFVYVWLRRAGILALIKRVLHGRAPKPGANTSGE